MGEMVMGDDRGIEVRLMVNFPSWMTKLGVKGLYQSYSSINTNAMPVAAIAGVLEQEICDITLEATKAIDRELDRIFNPKPVVTEPL